MDFTTFNRFGDGIDWGINTKGFSFFKLRDFFKSGTKILLVKGFFFVNSKNYGLQPVGITDYCLVNLPTNQRDTISNMLKNADAVNAIKRGELCIKIREYNSKYNKVCYDISYINTPKDFIENNKVPSAVELAQQA